MEEGVLLSDIAPDSFIIEHPADLVFGDYSTNVALTFGKKLKKSPMDFATRLADLMRAHLPEMVQHIEVARPGFINFHLAPKFFEESVKEILERGDDFGKTTIAKDQKWAVEYASPNPNKAMHLGHLRNVITGVSFNNILEANGATVIRDMVDNNRGIAIAKLMWGYLVAGKKDGVRVEDISYWQAHQDEWHTPESVGKKGDMFADGWYVKGSSESEDSEQEIKVRKLVVDWENKDEATWDLWRIVLSFAHQGQKQTLDRLGAKFDHVWHEHEHYEKGKSYVAEGLEKGIFKKLEDGAILTDLESFGISDTIVQKKDGTSLYITQDLALTDLKKKKYHADHLVWVIGPEQSLALQQLFAVCDQLGIGKREEFLHINYGYVSIKGQGKMSSRAGNVVYADDVLDEMKAKAKGIMKERVSEGDIDSIAEIIAKGAIVYEILKAGRNKDIAFDMEAALSFEGDSGPYLQYAHTRALSILRKAEEQGIKIDLESDLPFPESALAKKIYRLPGVFEEAFNIQASQQIVTYLTDLSATFNSFYAHTPILVDGDPASGKRLALVAAFAIVMKNGLAVLGIPVPERM